MKHAQGPEGLKAFRTPAPELLFIGNAIVDVYARTSAAFLRETGLAAPAQHTSYKKISSILAGLAVQDLLNPPSGVALSSGGGAANGAKAAGLLGMRAAFLGVTGADAAGGFFKRELEEARVTPLLFSSQKATGLCLVLKDERGKSRVAACPSAGLELKGESLDALSFTGLKAVVIDGFMLRRRGLIKKIVERASGVRIALDCASAALAAAHARFIAALCRRPLTLFMNEEEARSFCAELGQDTDQALLSLSLLPSGPVIAVKAGEKGARVFSGGKILQAKTRPLVPKDSTGAGDVFCGAFMAASVRGRSPAESAALANKAARIVLGCPGTAAGAAVKKQFARLASEMMRQEQGMRYGALN